MSLGDSSPAPPDRRDPPHRDLLERDHAGQLQGLAQVLANHRRRTMAIDGFRHAAVLLALVERNGTTCVPLIVRPTTMRSHSGQIGLPGGVRDPSDESLTATALREANEELGILPSEVRVIGLLDDVPTPSGFVITPVVGELVRSAPYVPNPSEVSELFEAPLQLFADPSGTEDLGWREAFGQRYRLRAYLIDHHRVWGATARILESLFELDDRR